MKKPTDEQYIFAAKRALREDGWFVRHDAKVKRETLTNNGKVEKGALVYLDPMWIPEEDAAAVK